MQLHPRLGSNLKLEKGSKQNCDLNTMLSFTGNLPIGIQKFQTIVVLVFMVQPGYMVLISV
jgi:hypothetical protein